MAQSSLDSGTQRLIRAVQELSLARDVEQIRGVVRSAAREMAQADGATFVLRDGDRCHYVDEDAIGPLWKGQRFPMTACISGWAMLNRRPAVVPDIFQDSRIPIDAYRPTFVKSLVMVPIREVDPIGAIGTYWATPRDASDQTIELLLALANSTAVAMENVRVYQELELRVQQRTAQLEAANQELDAFSYSVSHDLRAPLRHIRGFAGLLQEDAASALGDAGRGHVERIMSAAARMSQLIDDLLAFARLGRAPLAKQPVALEALLLDAQRDVMTDAGDRLIDWHIDAAAVVVSADAALLRQVLLNLLSNAVKYTRGRSPAQIEVRAQIDAARGEVVVAVRDNGAGFDPRYADRLFGVFQRLHSSDEFEGVGVGLANVRRIVHRHGGRTWAEGAKNQGATFWFTLPHPSAEAGRAA
jgi:signal transduction histidine kinase